jgi:hypothetical protein
MVEINELSKKTLGRYINKASEDRANAAAAEAEHWDKDREYAYSSGDRGDKREKGIRTAVKKLTKEGKEEQIDELSKQVVGRYLKKAGDSRADAAYTQGSITNNIHAKKSNSLVSQWKSAHSVENKREKGMDLAVKKLAKEGLDDLVMASMMQEPTQFAEIFDKVMTNVVTEKLAEKRIEIANKLFEGKKKDEDSEENAPSNPGSGDAD